jgi:uncharacterized protein with HEPN domain
MSQRDDTVSMRHMLDHAAEAVGLAKGKTLEELEQNRVLPPTSK